MWGLRSKGVESWEVGVCVATEPLWEAFHNGSIATHRRSREQKAARRRRQGMTVRPHDPAAAKQAASRARKQQAAQAQAHVRTARACGVPATAAMVSRWRGACARAGSVGRARRPQHRVTRWSVEKTVCFSATRRPTS